jgi:hypothetical protein
MITHQGCIFLALMGLSIPHFTPYNIGACIHYVDNHDCPNGVMPILALITMILSEFDLSFKEAHTIICNFARDASKGNGKKEQANLMWLWRKGWNNKENNKTAESIIEGMSKRFSNSSISYLTPASPPLPTQP